MVRNPCYKQSYLKVASRVSPLFSNSKSSANQLINTASISVLLNVVGSRLDFK